MPRISVEVTDEKLIEITVKAARLRLSKAEVARRLLDLWLEDEVEIVEHSNVGYRGAPDTRAFLETCCGGRND